MDEALQLRRLKGHVFGRSMNARNFAALAVTAGLLAFATQPPQRRRWPARRISPATGRAAARSPCRTARANASAAAAATAPAAMALSLSLRCASDSYKFELAQRHHLPTAATSPAPGTRPPGASSARCQARRPRATSQATAHAVGFTATLSIRASRQRAERVDPLAGQRNLRSLDLDGARRPTDRRRQPAQLLARSAAPVD